MHLQWLIYLPCDLTPHFELSSKVQLPPTPEFSLGKGLIESGCEGPEVSMLWASSLLSAAMGRGGVAKEDPGATLTLPLPSGSSSR